MKELLDYPINENGIGSIRLGMTSNKFIEKIYKQMDYDNGYLKLYGIPPDFLVYQYCNSIHLFFSLTKGILTRIHLENEFKGSYKDTIHIGSTIGQLKHFYGDIQMDDDYLFHRNEHITWVADDDVVSLSDSEANQCLIEAIIIKDYG